MTDMQTDAGRVGEHVEDVALGPAAPARGAERPVLVPVALPAGLDLEVVVAHIQLYPVAAVPPSVHGSGRRRCARLSVPRPRRREAIMADATRSIEVKPLTLHIGAEISGLDLSRPLAAAARTAINDALLRWKVVFFRGQHLDHAGHVAFARALGEPTVGHAVFGHIEG